MSFLRYSLPDVVRCQTRYHNAEDGRRDTREAESRVRRPKHQMNCSENSSLILQQEEEQRNRWESCQTLRREQGGNRKHARKTLEHDQHNQIREECNSSSNTKISYNYSKVQRVSDFQSSRVEKERELRLSITSLTRHQCE